MPINSTESLSSFTANSSHVTHSHCPSCSIKDICCKERSTTTSSTDAFSRSIARLARWQEKNIRKRDEVPESVYWNQFFPSID